MPRYLVCHDYGMGGLWWWITADSEAEILERVAEVAVVSDPETIARVADWDLEEVGLERASDVAGLSGLVAQRDAARARPGYGRFVGMERVWFAMPPLDGEEWWLELNGSGQILRAICHDTDGVWSRVVPDLNPMDDLYDPKYDNREIGEAQFDEVWDRAT